MLTPWGRSDQLRDRRLRPGPGKQRADVERNHRERLFGATVAIVDEEGHEGMNVGAAAARAGVSRGTVYEHFGGSQALFLATFEALMEKGLARVSRAYATSDGAWDDRLGVALDALFEAIVAQPAAGRLCFLETHAAGDAGAALRERGTAALEALVRAALEESPERAGMPAEVVCAIVGAIRTIVQTRLRRRLEHELPMLAPELLRWLSTYRRPDPALPEIHVEAAAEPRFVATSHRDRLFVALAETVHDKGYAETSVGDVVTKAGVSLSTFYKYYDGKEAAFLAACDFGIEQAFAAVSHAWSWERRNGWPEQVRAGMCELLAFLAAEPKWSDMAMVEIFAAGPRARARRDRTIELFIGLIEPGRELAPQVGPVMVEALGGAVYSLLYRHICHRGADTLPELLPATVFVLLAPFVGNREAAARAALSGSSPR